MFYVTSYAQMGREIKPVDEATQAKLKSAVEAAPNDLTAHQQYIKGIGGVANEKLPKQYEEWMTKYPELAIIPFAIGEAYANAESPNAKPWLLKAVARDPQMAKAYFYLWLDGERWGDFSGASEYLKKAMEADPSSPDYAFYYRSGFRETDPERYREGMLEMPKLFPESERGAQALYWLGYWTADTNDKIAIYIQLKNTYPPEKFRWSLSGMSGFFDAYLEQNPERALELAQEILSLPDIDEKTWNANLKLAQDLIRVKNLMAQNKAKEAQEIIAEVEVSRWSSVKEMIILLKAEIADAAGNTTLAYDKLLNYYASTPSDNVQKMLMEYGKKVGKGTEKVFDDIWKIRDADAVQATPCSFDLEQYLKSGKTSLSDYKGKVILLTYWFPGCGPCRGEFPNFEHVIKKFSEKEVVYIGINVVEEQDEYVVPFMKSSGYSFIPLKGETDKQGNLTAIGCPTNYLLDQEGRIVFKKFRINEHNERALELMIKELLEYHLNK